MAFTGIFCDVYCPSVMILFLCLRIATYSIHVSQLNETCVCVCVWRVCVCMCVWCLCVCVCGVCVWMCVYECVVCVCESVVCVCVFDECVCVW